MQSSRVLLLLSLPRPTTFTSPLPAILSARRAISRRNAGIRDENWYRSHVKSIIAVATNGPSVSRLLHSAAVKVVCLVVSCLRSSPRELSPYFDASLLPTWIALIVARFYLLHPDGSFTAEETLTKTWLHYRKYRAFEGIARSFPAEAGIAKPVLVIKCSR